MPSPLFAGRHKIEDDEEDDDDERSLTAKERNRLVDTPTVVLELDEELTEYEQKYKKFMTEPDEHRIDEYLDKLRALEKKMTAKVTGGRNTNLNSFYY